MSASCCSDLIAGHREVDTIAQAMDIVGGTPRKGSFTVPDTTHVPEITLNDGRRIPQLGFGVFQISPAETREATMLALDIGYRHVDTAEMYENEQGVGDAVLDSGLDRDAVWITSKLSNRMNEPDEIRAAFEQTLHKLDTDHVDLFLIHWPLTQRPGSDFVTRWKVLEEFHGDGRARSIGVSNFQIDDLKRLAAETDVVPAVNQIELHPYLVNDQLRTYGESLGIATEAWSPIAQGAVLDDPTIGEIARGLDRTPAQVVLRWHIQQGFIVFPKSTTAQRVQENFDIFDFTLTDEDMTQITSLDRGEGGRTGPNPDTFTGPKD
jgi:2,5-diketo-D-gluconate reductase A